MMLAACMLQPERNVPGVRSFELVPQGLRPRRLRSQLRITVILLAAVGLLYGGRMVGAVCEHYGQYTKLNSSVKSLKSRTTALQRKLRGKEKELKEKTRIIEQNAESHDLMLLLAELSNALPDSILASNVRLNESGIDLTLHTNMEDVDLAGALRRFPAFKVGTLQNRKVSDTLNVITLRLRRNQEKK
jgi:Tfp pilus assembly protein PilN